MQCIINGQGIYLIDIFEIIDAFFSTESILGQLERLALCFPPGSPSFNMLRFQLWKYAMPNLATILKQEIVRLARKEVRAEVQLLRKTGAQSRTDIAALKRRVAALEKLVARLGKASVAKKVETAQQSTPGVRFSAKGFAALRRRLDLSAAEMGLLLGSSDQSVYKWERGVRPRAQQLPQIAALRKLSRRQASDLLKSRQQ